MKKIYSIICILFVAHSSLLLAQTECATIAQVKALAAKTECVYTGTATTTYYDGYNGVVMQDETGAILLESSYLTETNSEKVKVGMTITNVVGVFYPEDNNYMMRIKVAKKAIASIEVKSENATFEVTTIDFDEYINNLDEYSAKPVRFENVFIRPVVGTSNYKIYSLKSDKELTVSFTNALGMIVPARADLEGFLSKDYSGKIFRVASAEAVTPYAYTSIKNIKNAVVELSDKEYDLVDTFTVTNVIDNGDNRIVYVQDAVLAQNPANYALRVEMSSSVDVDNLKVGNRIVGLSGKLIPAQKGDDPKGATFIQNSQKDVKVVSSIGQAKVLGKYIYELLDNDMQNAFSYDAGLICFSDGVVTKNSKGTYSYVVENENGQGKKSVALQMANDIDLSAFEGKKCPVQGVLDIAATYPENKMTLIMRSEKDFLNSVMEYETIGDIISAGAPVVDIEYKLINPALVTYRFSKTQGTPTYFAIVQDSTAAIVLSFGDKNFTNIEVGDSIVGICGVYDARSKTNILNVDEEQRMSMTVKNNDNPIVGIKVTLKDILDDKTLYENRVVEVNGIINNYKEEGDVKEGYFEQDGYRLQYTTGDNSGNFTYYPYMTIIGVVDNKLIGEQFSLWPLSQDHIIKLDSVPTDVEPDTNYMDTIYVEFTITTEDLPYKYDTLYYDENTLPGVYVDTIKGTDKEGKECVIIHTLTIEEVSAIEGVNDLDLIMYPSPISANSTLYINADFTVEERSDLRIEIFNSLGQCVYVDTPFIYPIEIDCLSSSGVYIVRVITGDDKCYRGKIVVE